MKKLIALILIAVIMMIVTGCGSTPSERSEATETETPQEALSQDIKIQLDEVLADYEIEGVVQITQDGEIIYQYVKGNGDNGQPLTIGSSLPIGSVSRSGRAHV